MVLSCGGSFPSIHILMVLILNAYYCILFGNPWLLVVAAVVDS